MKAIILAGGKGTRLAPYTTILPKPLMPVDDRPILDIVIHQLVHYGIDEIILSVGYLAELLEAYYQDGSRFGIPISYVREPEPLGTAGPVALINQQHSLDETFLVMNGDVLTDFNYRHLIDYHNEKKGILTIAMHAKQQKIDLGVMHVNDNYELTDYIEKPTLDYQVSMGIYIFDSAVLKYIQPGVRLDFNELVLSLVKKHREPVFGYPCTDYWLDIGRHDDYEQATEVFMQDKAKFLGEE